MAWYDKLREQGIVVRGEVDLIKNEFPKDKLPKWKKEKRKHVLDSEGNKIPILDEEGKQIFDYQYLDRDVYIQCITPNKDDKIVCLTAEESHCRKHIYMACITNYNRGINILRRFDEECLSGGRDSNGEYNNIKMFKRIEKDGRIFDIEENYNKKLEIKDKNGEIIEKCKTNDELLFCTYDLDLLSKLISIKRVKGKSAHPFDEKYLIWNKYAIPEEDMNSYIEVRDIKFGKQTKDTFGTNESRKINKQIEELTSVFMDKHEINKNKKRELRIRDNKEIIHSLGLWEEFIGVFS